MMELVCCPECGDTIDVRLDAEKYHTSCCAHDQVEDIDNRDGVRGRRFAWCADCGSELVPVEDEDGISWEPVE